MYFVVEKKIQQDINSVDNEEKFNKENFSEI